MAMRVVTKIAICILVMLLIAVALLGGLIRQSFCRFFPVSPIGTTGFTLSIKPEFTEGGTNGGFETIVPLFYRQSIESTHTPRIFVDLTAYSPAYGYTDKVSITLTTVEAVNESGQTFSLIRPRESRTFPVDHSGFGHRREDLGAVSGEHLSLTAEGFTTDISGAKVPFHQSSRWSVYRSSRTNLAAAMSD